MTIIKTKFLVCWFLKEIQFQIIDIMEKYTQNPVFCWLKWCNIIFKGQKPITMSVIEVLQMPSVTCSPRCCRCYYCSTDTDQYIFSVTFPQGSRQQTLDWPLFACSGSHQLQFRGSGARHWAVRPGPGNLWQYKADLNGCPLSCVLGEASRNRTLCKLWPCSRNLWGIYNSLTCSSN